MTEPGYNIVMMSNFSGLTVSERGELGVRQVQVSYICLLLLNIQGGSGKLKSIEALWRY